MSSQVITELGNYQSEFSDLEKAIAELCRLEPCRQYFDEIYVGRPARRKPGFLKMIKDAEDGKFDVILTDDIFTL